MRVDGRTSDQHEMPAEPGSGPMQPLTATFTMGRAGSAGVIVAAGELDLQTDGAFGAALDAARASGGDLLVVDLSAVTFMGSAGIAQLVRLYREEVRTVVVTQSRVVLRTLELTGLREVIAVYATVAAALSS